MSDFNSKDAFEAIAALCRKALTDAYKLDDPYQARTIECQEIGKILAIANTGANEDSMHRHWLDLPRGVKLTRYTDGESTTFVGQYVNEYGSKADRPKRIFKVIVSREGNDVDGPCCSIFVKDGEDYILDGTVHCRLSRAEYIGVKALKTYLFHCEKECRRTHRQHREKRSKAND